MLDSLKKRPGALRWPPRQRFTVTDSGREALQRYRDAITLSHKSNLDARELLTRAQREWAGSYQVEGSDATVLEEFAAGQLLPREVQASLEDCGISLQDVQAAVDRLFTAGLLAPATKDGQPGSGPLSGGTNAGGF